MKIYTKTGDKGTTSLANGRRVPKNSLRVEAYGTIDELNSVIGITLAQDVPEEMQSPLTHLSTELFSLGADLASPIGDKLKSEPLRITDRHISWLEEQIDYMTEKLPPLTHFILPGGTKTSVFLNNARTVCRRAERIIISLAAEEEIGNHIIIYMNRLSDYLFTASRYANFLAGIEDVKWE